MRETKGKTFVPKAIDKGALIGQRMKESLVAAKEKTDDIKNDTPTDYAQDKAGEAAQFIEGRVERNLLKKRYRVHKADIHSSNATLTSARNSANIARQRATAQGTAQASREAAERSGNVIKKLAKSTGAVVRKITEAFKSLVAALGAGGVVVAVLVVIIILIAMLVASPFGIFLSGEAGDNGYSMRDTTAQLTEEYYDEVDRIEAEVTHDRVEVISSDGLKAINWEDVLAVYAVRTTSGQDGVDVATMDERKLDILRSVMWSMNEIEYSTKVITVEIPVTVINEDGEEETEIQTFYETILTIDLTHKTSEGAAAMYGFTSSQIEQLAELQSEQYANLWSNLIGAYRDANGEIIHTGASWIPNGFFSWPLPINGDFNSPFGYRHDPFTGAVKFHGGIDLGAPQDTQILAAAGGTVVVANATDPWGYGYGYHVTIDHGNGYSTLYGHCNAVAVTPGQTVQRGQVIAYVGTTGNSTGNHLHFEVYQGGVRIDPMGFFS